MDAVWGVEESYVAVSLFLAKTKVYFDDVTREERKEHEKRKQLLIGSRLRE